MILTHVSSDRRHTHHLPRLFTVSIVGQTFATVCFTIHYLSFTMTDPSDDLPSVKYTSNPHHSLITCDISDRLLVATER